jgi:hypothetical protein
MFKILRFKFLKPGILGPFIPTIWKKIQILYSIIYHRFADRRKAQGKTEITSLGLVPYALRLSSYVKPEINDIPVLHKVFFAFKSYPPCCPGFSEASIFLQIIVR